MSRGKTPVLRDQTILTLSDLRLATAQDLSVSTAFAYTLVHGGFIRTRGTVKVVPGQGRPRRQFSLTPKGRGRARTLARVAA